MPIDEEILRSRMSHLGESMVGVESDGYDPMTPKQDRTTQSRRAFVLVASSALVGVAVALALALSARSSGEARTDRATPPAEQPSVPSPEPSTTAVDTPLEPIPPAPGEIPVDGGEPSAAVIFVGDALGAELIDWEHREVSGYWAATYRSPNGSNAPTDVATFSAGNASNREFSAEEDLSETYLPGGTEVAVTGADAAFYRPSGGSSVLSMVVDTRLFVLTVGESFRLDERQVIELGGAILQGLPS